MTDRQMLDKPTAIILAVSVFLGIVYFFAHPWKADIPLNWMLKGSGIFLLAVVAWKTERPMHKGLALALAFGLGGDVLLEISTFVAGLGSFLISHLVYTVLFILVMRETGMAGTGRKVLAFLIALTALGLANWFYPDLGEFAIPVLIYISVIAAMAIAAALTPFASNRVLIGALLFMLSDSLIALGKFKTGFPGISHGIWGTYYMAQYLIMTGFLAGWRQNRLQGQFS